MKKKTITNPKTQEQILKQVFIDAGLKLGVVSVRSGMNQHTFRGKLNNSIVNEKDTLCFTSEEMKAVAYAVKTIAQELLQAAYKFEK